VTNTQAVAFEAPGLGDRSYLVHDGVVAVVIDPQREQERYIEAAERLGVRITHVLETHVHNDYVSGGLGLAREVGATYVLPEGEDLAFALECEEIGDGAQVRTGALNIAALATPGHTPHHLSYLVSSATDVTGFILTGGSILPGGVGRTDLLGHERADELARAQWHSVRRLLTELDPSTQVLPTHGFGSFCSASPSGGAQSALTVAIEKERNPAMRSAVEDFVTSLRACPPPIPAYYRYMAPINRRGAITPGYGRLARLGRPDLDRLLATGSFVIDLRPRRTFAAGHRQGVLNIELGDNLTTYFGWIIPFEGPYSLVATSDEEVEESRHLLARIGREDVAGYFLARDLDLEHAQHYPVASFADLGRTIGRGDKPLVLDIRHQSEWRAGHLVVARHVPLPELGACRSVLPPEQEIWVHCATGFRAAIATSQLSAWGMSPVLIDDRFEQAALNNLEIEVEEAVATKHP
jgi:hydroxyacylglutathione hydrolase